MSAGELSVNAYDNFAEHAHYKKEMFPKTWWVRCEQSAESGKKKKSY